MISSISAIPRNLIRPAFPTYTFVLCLVVTATSLSAGALDIPVSSWRAIPYAAGTVPDPVNDQQTGIAEGDLVGGMVDGVYHSSAYIHFDSGLSSSLTDGTLSLRARLRGDEGRPGFDGVLLVGFDANVDGSVDLFAGVNNQGSSQEIGIYATGSGSNMTPSSTDIGQALQTYTQSAGNYRWEPVTRDNDPALATDSGSDSQDHDGGTVASASGAKKDESADSSYDSAQFLSFSLPFQDLVAQLEAMGISFDETSETGLIVATATQINRINQDFNGIEDGIDSETPWSELGAVSVVDSTSGFSSGGSWGPSTPVPEPSALLLLGMCALLTCTARRRRST